MSVVSYRIYCDECDNETVIRERDMENSLWVINNKHWYSGICPECNDMVLVEDIEEDRESREDDSEPVDFAEIDGIGEATATALKRAGLRTRGDVRVASDAKLMEVNGVGKSKINQIRDAVA